MSKRAAIAIGSNLGDRLGNLQMARDRIRTLDGVTWPAVQSAVYETSPVDCEAGAPKFYNAVIEIGFEKSAEELFEALHEIERALGRNREMPSASAGRGGREMPGGDMRKGNVSRTIDLDLLYFGSEERAEPSLQLPHPRMTARRFVLQPLCDIAPDLRLPGQTKNVGELLAELGEQGKIVRLTDTW
jgi:2-amino-4-hydroxy-6-hydroxymethyldihydropteridine diphosphokinase